MANCREIQARMKSIKDTMKITKAMYMISSSKLKKAKSNLQDTEPYFYTLQEAISDILRYVPDLNHPFFDAKEDKPKEEKREAYILVTADKGLAGAYNHNVIKIVEQLIANNSRFKLFAVGMVGRNYFAKRNVEIDMDFQYTVQNPSLHRARFIVGNIVEMYKNGEFDEVHVIYTKMKNAVEEVVEDVQLLPLKKADFEEKGEGFQTESVEFIPSLDEVLETIVPDYVSGFMYGAIVEAFCCEQNARMMAMQSSTDNAKEMLKELQVTYNRVRQAAITQEITEVAGGAKAQKKKKV